MAKNTAAAALSIVALLALLGIAVGSSGGGGGGGGDTYPEPKTDEWNAELARLTAAYQRAVLNYTNNPTPQNLIIMNEASVALARFLQASNQQNTQSTTGSTTTTTTGSVTTEPTTSVSDQPIGTVTTSSGWQRPVYDPHYQGDVCTSDGYEVYQAGVMITKAVIDNIKAELFHPNGWMTSTHEVWYKEGVSLTHTQKYNEILAYKQRVCGG